MHYGSHAFSKNGKRTIKAIKQPNEQFGQRRGFSETDIHQLNALYDCKSKLNWGFVNHSSHVRRKSKGDESGSKSATTDAKCKRKRKRKSKPQVSPNEGANASTNVNESANATHAQAQTY